MILEYFVKCRIQIPQCITLRVIRSFACFCLYILQSPSILFFLSFYSSLFIFSLTPLFPYSTVSHFLPPCTVSIISFSFILLFFLSFFSLFSSQFSLFSFSPPLFSFVPIVWFLSYLCYFPHVYYSLRSLFFFPFPTIVFSLNYCHRSLLLFPFCYFVPPP